MVKSVENGLALPPFLVKCYEMVNDESTNELISWSVSNDSFIIWDASRCSSQLLPKYFKHSNFSSFVRQLNTYGFRKIDTDHWQFANEYFIKGQKHLLKNIIRKKHHPQKKNQALPHQDTDPTSRPEHDIKTALWKEVETLKNDKIALTQELKKLSQHQQISRSKMLVLRDQLKGMERNQQQMLSFIVMAMQSPGFMLQFFQPKENSWRVSENGNNSSKLSEVIDDDYETSRPSEEGAIVRYQPPEASSRLPEDLVGMDFSSDEIRYLFMDVDVLLGGDDRGELVLPDVRENDDMLEKLLLPYTCAENEQLGSTVGSDGSDNDDFGGSRYGVVEDSFRIVEGLTERMGVLSSEIGGDAVRSLAVPPNPAPLV